MAWRRRRPPDVRGPDGLRRSVRLARDDRGAAARTYRTRGARAARPVASRSRGAAGSARRAYALRSRDRCPGDLRTAWLSGIWIGLARTAHARARTARPGRAGHAP